MIEIREPKFKVGDKVTTPQEGKKAVGTIEGIKFYDFSKGTYIYIVELEKDGFTDKQYIDELVLDIYVEKQKNVWGLKDGDTYYVISGYGEVLETTWKYNIDSNSRKIGNAFLTKEEAEFEVERRKIETEMIRLGGRRSFKFNEKNYSMYYSNDLYVKSYEIAYPGLIYFDSKKEVDNAIETIRKDRILKYIFRFGVEE